MDGVVPVEIVIARYCRPTRGSEASSALCVQRMPVSALRHHNILPGESERPDVRRVRVSDARFDRRRHLRAAKSPRQRKAWLRKIILDMRIAFYAAPRPGRAANASAISRAALSLELRSRCRRTMLKPAFAQPLQD